MKLISTSILVFSTLATCQKRKPKSATAELAFDIDKWIHKTSDPNVNSIYSPVSLYNILASVYFGTGETSETRKELQEKFNFKKKFNVKKYSKQLDAMTRHNALDNFNSYIFHKNNVKSQYARDVRFLNFKDKPLKTFIGKEKTINGIVKKDTDGMIKNMFAPDSFDEQTSMVLLNTILFKGAWDETLGIFNAGVKKRDWMSGTEEGASGPFVAEFMKSRNRELLYQWDDGTQFISLKFKSEKKRPAKIGSVVSTIKKSPVYMTIAMPTSFSKNKAYEINFNDVKWRKFHQIRNAELIFPKFEIDSELNLIDFMTEQNATRLFSGKTADLDRMFGKNSGNYVADFRQKASIKVDEKGVKAAAATGSRTVVKMMPPQFKINMPFKFFIHNLNPQSRDRHPGGSLFFSGVVNCPMNNCS